MADRSYRLLNDLERITEARRFHQFLIDRYGVDSEFNLKEARREYRNETPPAKSVFTAYHYRILMMIGKGVRKKGKRSDPVYTIRPASDWAVAVGSEEEAMSGYLKDAKSTGEHEKATTFALKLLKKHRHSLLKDKQNITISAERFDCANQIGRMEFKITEDDSSALLTAEIVIANTSNTDPVEFLDCAFFADNPDFSLDHEVSINSAVLDAGKSCIVRCTYRPSTVGVTENNVLVFAFQSKMQKFHIIRLVRGHNQSHIARELEPTEPYKRASAVVSRNDEQSRTKRRGRRPELFERKVELPMVTNDTKKFKYQDVLRQSRLNGNQPSPALRNRLRQNLQERYCDVFAALIACEEQQMWIDIRKYDLPDAVLVPKGQFLELAVPGLAEKRPSLLVGDRLYATSSDPEYRSYQFQAFVHQVLRDEVWLQFEKGFHDNVQGKKFDIRFTFNRLPTRLQHRAIEMVQNKPSLMNVLFPLGGVGTQSVYHRITFYDQKVERNERQKQAVLDIVSGRSRPAPYIIFGPPGTGKTVTTAEAMRQVLKCIGGSRILACAPSNTAADLLCQKLVEHHGSISITEIIRMNSQTRGSEGVPNDIEKLSRVDVKIQDVLRSRVVICTLVTSGRMVTAREKGLIPESFFTHIFIDECGQAVEPECVIPVAGLLHPEKGQLVLAGDPEQLGPVLRSSVAIRHGFQISLLERLMKSGKGKAGGKGGGCGKGDGVGKSDGGGKGDGDSKSDDGDSKSDDDSKSDGGGKGDGGVQLHPYVTKLLENYRSHPAILSVPNESFYDNELQPRADKIKREKFCEWEHLHKGGFPIIFHGVMGEEKRESSNPSYFNPEEITQVVKYIELLRTTRGPCQIKPEDFAKNIGVISPYRKQVIKISKVLRNKGLSDIKVGSVEEFQGQERTVIIISTVRSNPDLLEIDKKYNLGFLQNPKRFNVAITRTKALCIVIGNPHLLILDPHWKKFIHYVRLHGGYTGCRFRDEEKEEDEMLQAFPDLGLDDAEAYSSDDDEEKERISKVQLQEEPEMRGSH